MKENAAWPGCELGDLTCRLTPTHVSFSVMLRWQFLLGVWRISRMEGPQLLHMPCHLRVLDAWCRTLICNSQLRPQVSAPCVCSKLGAPSPGTCLESNPDRNHPPELRQPVSCYNLSEVPITTSLTTTPGPPSNHSDLIAYQPFRPEPFRNETWLQVLNARNDNERAKAGAVSTGFLGDHLRAFWSHTHVHFSHMYMCMWI